MPQTQRARRLLHGGCGHKAGMTERGQSVAKTKRDSILRDFLKDEAAGGIVLIVAALLAMIAANSPLAS